jgi:hypothetical protein
MLTNPDSIAEHFRFTLSLICAGVDLEDEKIAQILAEQAAAVLSNVFDDARSTELMAIARRIETAETVIV